MYKKRNFMFLFQNPYPTDVDKLKLVEQTNLSLVQVENWFINARRRILQKMLARGNKFEASALKCKQLVYMCV